MELAMLRADEGGQLRAALAVCKLAKEDDPRATVAALRLSQSGRNSEAFRELRAAIEKLSAGESACAPAAREAMYAASLDGLPNTDVRDLAQRSGWLTQWTISRTGVAAVKTAPEQFEFPDARMQLPDYLPRGASYTADASYIAPHDGVYDVLGDVPGTKIAIDEKEPVPGTVALSTGPHHLRITFRAADATPRIRIRPTTRGSESISANAELSAREAIYLHAAILLGTRQEASAVQEVRDSEFAATTIGRSFLQQATHASPPSAPFESALSHPSCGNLETALNTPQSAAIADRLQYCAPDSLAYAHWLAGVNRHSEEIRELSRLLQDWPLDREAHRMLIAELQRGGDNQAADQAAAAFLAIAPNARNFRRMAQSAASAPNQPTGLPFYEPYRRPAPPALSAYAGPDTPAVILLQDKVAISRLDGSVSLYMHRVVQLMNDAGVEKFRPLAVPESAQLLTARVVNNPRSLPSTLKPGDEIEEEYVVHYTGDGGMISHPEAFQYVFNDFDFPLLDARFIVLSPATQTPGYVIASGDVPESRMAYTGTLRAQIWQMRCTAPSPDISNPAIIRVVENENGWSIPPSIERRRILETIHPGPRPREA